MAVEEKLLRVWATHLFGTQISVQSHKILCLWVEGRVTFSWQAIVSINKLHITPIGILPWMP